MKNVITEEELAGFSDRYCRACGSQRCPGVFDGTWRTGCGMFNGEFCGNAAELRNGDCLERMKWIPDKSVDCIVCDLPYYRVANDDFDNQWKTASDYLMWVEHVIKGYYRVHNSSKKF